MLPHYPTCAAFSAVVWLLFAPCSLRPEGCPGSHHHEVMRGVPCSSPLQHGLGLCRAVCSSPVLPLPEPQQRGYVGRGGDGGSAAAVGQEWRGAGIAQAAGRGLKAGMGRGAAARGTRSPGTSGTLSWR